MRRGYKPLSVALETTETMEKNLPLRTDRRSGLRMLSLGLIGLTPLYACTIGAGPNHAGRDAPTTGPIADRLTGGRPFALVLSSGGPRGFVHIGVIEALDELGIRPDLVVGASIGSLVGALYCGGLSGKAMREIAMDLGPTQFASFAVGTRERFSGAPIARLVNYQVDHRLLQDLRPACVVVSREQRSGKVVAFTQGNVGTAVQASTAIEGRFTPVTIRSLAYVDPDKAMPLPVRLARQLGAGRVMSVDASAHEDRAPAGSERFRESDRLKRVLTEPDAMASDLNLHPDFGYWVSLSSEFRERCMRAGYEAVMQSQGRIKKLAGTHA